MDQVEDIQNLTHAEIVQHVQSLRESRGLTQAALASLLGVSTGTVRGLEAGRTTWNIRHLAMVAAAFDVQLHELITGPLPTSVATTDQEKVLRSMETGDPVAVMRAVADWAAAQPEQRLTPQQRRAVTAIATGQPAELMSIAAEMMRAQGGYD